MNKKRILACLIAGAMALTMTVTAGAGAPPGFGESHMGTGSGAGTDTSGVGDIQYISPRIFNVTLPTDNAFDFVVDPQGLLGASGPTNCLIELAENAGRIHFNDAPAIINNSGVPVTVTASFQVTGNATHLTIPAENSPSNAGTMSGGTVSDPITFPEGNLLGGEEILEMLGRNTANSVVMYMSPSLEAIRSLDDDGESSGLGYVLGSSASTFRFVLDAATYNYNADEHTLELVPETGHGTRLQVGGWVNRNADWEGFTQDALIPFPPSAAQIAEHGDGAVVWAIGADMGGENAGRTTGNSNRTAFPAGADPSAATPVMGTTPENTATAEFHGVDGIRFSGGSPSRPTNLLWTIGGEEVALPRAVNPALFLQAWQTNRAARTMDLRANFRFVEATEDDITAMERPFAWGLGRDGAPSFTAGGDGFANRGGIGVSEPVAYGLMGFSVNSRRIVLPGEAGARGARAGFVTATSSAPRATLHGGAGRFHWIEFRNTPDTILPTAVGVAGQANWTLTRNGVSVLSTAAAGLVNTTTSTAANTSISINNTPAVTTFAGAFAADPDLGYIISRVGVSLGTSNVPAAGLNQGDQFVVTVTIGGTTFTHTVTIAD